MISRFNPSRLEIARQRRKLTKKALAELVGLAPLTITRLESGGNPEEGTVKRIASALMYPVGFFYGPDIERPNVHDVSFRSLSRTPARERDAALAAGAVAYLISDWVEERFNLPVLNLLDFSHIGDPRSAARSLRQHWGIGERPVSNMVRLLESKGIRVFALAENTQSVDAFCCWREGRPFIFLNTRKTAERSRFDAAHELGHLVLHRHGSPTGRQAEDEANLFASHFLIPEADLAAQTPIVTSLRQVIDLKRRWGVSAAALVYRLNQDGYISDWQSRGFFIDIKQRFPEEEPEGMLRERSIVWGKVLQALWQEGITVERVAAELKLPPLAVAEMLVASDRGVNALNEQPSAFRIVT